ncbi:MAG: putative transporter [Methanoregula sp. PtaU1.Bin051]|nr:MAG: putative transporter [Methanoregula sp. PtaU1.Bin051]
MPDLQQSRSFRKSLGLIELVSLGVGGTIGSGIFVVPGIAARISGPVSLVAWVIVAVSASCVLLSLAGISSRFKETGSFFGLFSSVFGNRIALPVIILYLVSSTFGIATIASGIGQYLMHLGIRETFPLEIAILVLFCVINIIGISLSGKTEIVLTVLKTVPLVIITILLLPYIRPENFMPAAPVGAGSIIATVIIVYWPFTGFEISAIPVEETKNISLIRRSLLLVMIIVTSVYLLLNIALIGSIGIGPLAASPAPLATAAGLIFSSSGPIVAIIGIIAMLSALNAYIIATSRVLQDISARHSLPYLSGLGTRGTPTVALVASCGACIMLLFVSNHFELLASVSVITTLIPYIFFCLSSWISETGIRSRAIAGTGALSTAAILVLYFLIG